MVMRPSSHIFPGVKARIDRDLTSIRDTIDHIRPFAFHPALNAISKAQTNDTDPFWINDYVFEGDARAMCGMIGAYKPGTVLEIGSGNSTKFMKWASRAFNADTQIVSIDPQPRAAIDSLCARTIRKSLLDVDPSEFAALKAGDFVFMDGSHLTFNGTDTTYFFLEALPVLKPGVIVHVHDITLPYEYIDEFTERGYSEQYMLATAILNNPNYRVLLPVYYANKLNMFMAGGGSFWMVAP